MPVKLPDHVAARRLAEEGAAIQAEVAADRLSRLPGSFVLTSPVAVSVKFGLEEHGRPRITGELRGTMATTCQRCLEPMTIAITCAVDQVLADDSCTPDALETSDYVIGPGDTVDLRALVEDELILGCPMIATHARGACKPPVDIGAEGAAEHPFATLPGLLGRSE